MSDALRHLATRVTADPFFLAHPLAEFARSEGLDDPGLAARLGCRIEDLTLLRLCRAPRPEPKEFRADLAAVAARFGLDSGALAAAVRHGQGLATLRSASRPDGPPGTLLAARDDDPPPAESTT
ncbi:MAG: hypothetical protein JWO38_2567 [Gemmataceae bacterium]|nr:hypothetical protein [Gemmataceae bacterium]